MKKIYIFDVDGTICRSKDGKYRQSKPIKKRIKKVNELFDKGNTIIFFTSRGKLTNIDWSKLTNYQFKKWKVKHHDIIFGKPYGDVYVGDEALSDKEFFKFK